jgi:4-hydroxybenzoate polyprenyltransferase
MANGSQKAGSQRAGPEKASPNLIEELGRSALQYAQLMRLDRPIGIWLLLWPALWGLWIAGDGHPEPHLFLIFVLGAIVMRSAGCVINDFADRKIDAQVARTKDRPIVRGDVAPGEALVLFIALCLIAIALVLSLNPLARKYAIGAAILTIVYPFSKRFFSAPQLLLGAAFGWSIPMAFAAQTGRVSRLAWLMWLAVVIWAVIYDTMYAMADREDDKRAGVRSTAILFGNTDIFVITLLQVTLLLALMLIGVAAGLGYWYQVSVGIAALFMVYQHNLIKDREPGKCIQAFLNNRYVGATIFAGIVLAYTFRQ